MLVHGISEFGGPSDYGIDRLSLSEHEELCFCGTNGQNITKHSHKVTLLSSAKVVYNIGESVIEVHGSFQQRRLAQKYFQAIVAQVTGTATLQPDHSDGDLTLLSLPGEAVGAVQEALKDTVLVNSVIALFCRLACGERAVDEQSLAIFGSVEERRRVELRLLAIVVGYTPMFLSREQVQMEVLDRDRGADSTGTWGTDTVSFQRGNREQFQYLSGRGGDTGQKLALVSGALVQYVGHAAFLSGPAIQRARAKQFVTWCLTNFNERGPSNIGMPLQAEVENEYQGDCTFVEVPQDCVGYVMGKHRKGLAALEEKYCVLLWFFRQGTTDEPSQPLGIFGSVRSRKAAEWEVMSRLERIKRPGLFSRRFRDSCSCEFGFDIDCIMLNDSEFAAIICGKDGATRKKLMQATGALCNVIGESICIAGTRDERTRMREQIQYMRQGSKLNSVQQRDLEREVEERPDLTMLRISIQVQTLIQSRSQRMVQIQHDASACMYVGLTAPRLFIFSVCDEARFVAQRLVEDLCDQSGLVLIEETPVETAPTDGGAVDEPELENQDVLERGFAPAPASELAAPDADDLCAVMDLMVQRGLSEQGAQQYVVSFIDNGFDTESAFDMLTEEDLDLLGVMKEGHRRLLLRARARAAALAPAEATEAPTKIPRIDQAARPLPEAAPAAAEKRVGHTVFSYASWRDSKRGRCSQDK